MWTNLRALALICFVLPIITVIISYIASVKLDLVTACIPNFEGCSSISRAGRYAPVKYFFKPMMYLYAIILFFYWKNYQCNSLKLNLVHKVFFLIFLLNYGLLHLLIMLLVI